MSDFKKAKTDFDKLKGIDEGTTAQLIAFCKEKIGL